MSRKNSGRKPDNASFLIVALSLFSLIALVFGVIPLYKALAALGQCRAMKTWVEVPAWVLSAETVARSSGSSRRRSTHYKINARFEYAWRGKVFIGTRTDLFQELAESDGSYQRKFVVELLDRKGRGERVPCYVNPENPEEAILCREMRWGLFFILAFLGGVFCAAGVSCLAQAARRVGVAALECGLRKRHPEAPWRWKREWLAGQVRYSLHNPARLLTIGAILWNVCGVLPLVLLTPEMFTRLRPEAAWLWIFPPLGALLVAAAAFAWWRWAALGDPVFRFGDAPGAVGGMLTGTIRTRMRRRSHGAGVVRLSCMRKKVHSMGQLTEQLWAEMRSIRPEAVGVDAEGMTIPVRFAIPYDCEMTDGETGVFWVLELLGELEPGASVLARFDVPVFMTEASDPRFVPDEEKLAHTNPRATAEDILRAAAIRVEPRPGGGMRYGLRRDRRLTEPNLILALGGIILTGAAVALWFLSAPFLLALAFSLFALLAVCFFLDYWFWSGRLEVTARGVVIAAGIFRQPQVRIALEEIQCFELHLAMHQGNPQGEPKFLDYCIKLKRRSGQQMTLCKGIRERWIGEAMISALEQELLEASAAGVSRP